MATTLAPTRMSHQEFVALCHSSDLWLEQTRDGEIRVTPAGGNSSFANIEISGQLRDWWKQHRRGAIFDSSAGFHLPDGSTLSPDAAYATPEQIAPLTPRDREGFPPIAPAFVIELLSYTDRRPILREKMQDWLRNGVQLAWLIDPYARTVTVYQPGHEPAVHSELDIPGSGPVHGFTLDLREVWSKFD
jgi:Uma2 family endonuclease